MVPEYSVFSAALFPRFIPDKTRSGGVFFITSYSPASTQSAGDPSAEKRLVPNCVSIVG